MNTERQNAMATPPNLRALWGRVIALLGLMVAVPSVFTWSLGDWPMCLGGVLLILVGFVTMVTADMKRRVSAAGESTEIPMSPAVKQRIKVWHLGLLVAGCAVGITFLKQLDDAISLDKAPIRGLRAMKSSDSTVRTRALFELSLGLRKDSPPELHAAVTDALIVAHRDENARVREDAARTLFCDVRHRVEQGRPVPQLQAVVAVWARALGDDHREVRRIAALGLSGLCFMNGGDQRPLPADTKPLVDALVRALKDLDSQVSESAHWTLEAIVPRLAGDPPADLIAALKDPDRTRRAVAAEVISRFSQGHDAALPALLEALEKDAPSEFFTECETAVDSAKVTTASVPILAAALRSPNVRVRRAVAKSLSRLVPRPVSVVPDLLPLLEERFSWDPTRTHPEWFDPAVAATWALGAIAPGSPMAGRAEAALKKLLDDREHPWRAAQAQEALDGIHGITRGIPAGAKN